MNIDFIMFVNKFIYKDYIIWKVDKVRIDLLMFEIFFKLVCDGIVRYVKDLL